MGLRLLQINQSNCGRAEMKSYQFYETMKGRLRGLVGSVLYHPYSNMSVGISEGCFIFDFAS